MTTYSLYDYFDVWGNPEDGYEVNNLCLLCDDLYIADDSTESEIIDYLISEGFLLDTANGLVCIDCFGDGCEIYEEETGMPLFGLRKNHL